MTVQQLPMSVQTNRQANLPSLFSSEENTHAIGYMHHIKYCQILGGQANSAISATHRKGEIKQ